MVRQAQGLAGFGDVAFLDQLGQGPQENRLREAQPASNLLNGRAKSNDHKNSLLWTRVNSGNMPKNSSKLPQHQINIIRDWLEPDQTAGSSGLSNGVENN